MAATPLVLSFAPGEPGVMRADDDDFFYATRSPDFDVEIVAFDAEDFVLQASCLVTSLPESGLDVIRRLCQLPRTISHVPLANVNGEVFDVLTKLIGKGHQSLVSRGEFAAIARSRHPDHNPPLIRVVIDSAPARSHARPGR
jgi:hypothetical protein